MLIFAAKTLATLTREHSESRSQPTKPFRRMGMPEGVYPIAHACLYLACCPKSNAVKRAWQSARQAIADHGSLPVPKRLRNPVTRLMREEGYGEGYRYPHDTKGASFLERPTCPTSSSARASTSRAPKAWSVRSASDWRGSRPTRGTRRRRVGAPLSLDRVRTAARRPRTSFNTRSLMNSVFGRPGRSAHGGARRRATARSRR